ncbi:serine/threonine-protein kinase [Terriglobus sp.]|uniref:serine/threonine-protein kinase n=1 Tax=Terriglobus sp. TaxID=1889013 RepID=UPI003B0051FA
MNGESRSDTNELAERLRIVLGSRFEVERPLAIGGMATIFLLRHRLHRGPFVAKVLHPELVERAGVLSSFRLEATHAALLGDHPNAVPVFDFGELDGLFFLLMPYIGGEDLDQILARQGPLGREEALQMAAQMSSLLCHAESQSVVHCDLTPGNIRRDTFGHYRLLDLGISQTNGPQDRPFVGGTPLYASPEQLRGEPLDIRSDLYSLGAVLGEALSGTPLFQGTSMKEIRNRHLHGVWRMPEVLEESDPVARLLHALLSVDVAARPQSAYELSGILHACGSARPEFRPASNPEQRMASSTGHSQRKRLTTEIGEALRSSS